MQDQQETIRRNEENIRLLEDNLHDLEVIRNYPVPAYLSMEHVNFGVLGIAGAGKSSFINALFE